MNFIDYIFEKSKKFNDKTAIFHKNETLSYSDLYSLIRNVIGKLNSLNIKKDEKIILMGDNSFFLVISYLSVIASGRVIVPIHPAFGKENFIYAVKSCKVNSFFIQKKYWKRFKEYNVEFDNVFSDSEIEGTINAFDLRNYSGDIDNSKEKNDLALIFFTSGSTGKPKGVMLSHHNLKYNTNSIIEYLKLEPSDRIMVILPFTYCFGASLLHTHLRVGGQVVINNLFMFPGKVLDEINEKKCTGFAGVPSVFSILLRRLFRLLQMELFCSPGKMNSSLMRGKKEGGNHIGMW
ncbi:MAG: AMP-binding protein [Candidatus Hermodarchaeota archaeon]